MKTITETKSEWNEMVATYLGLENAKERFDRLRNQALASGRWADIKSAPPTARAMDIMLKSAHKLLAWARDQDKAAQDMRKMLIIKDGG